MVDLGALDGHGDVGGNAIEQENAYAPVIAVAAGARDRDVLLVGQSVAIRGGKPDDYRILIDSGGSIHV